MSKFILILGSIFATASAQAKVCSHIGLSQNLKNEMLAAVQFHCANTPDLLDMTVDEGSVQDCQADGGASYREYIAIVDIRLDSGTDLHQFKSVEVTVTEAGDLRLPIIVRGAGCSRR